MIYNIRTKKNEKHFNAENFFSLYYRYPYKKKIDPKKKRRDFFVYKDDRVEDHKYSLDYYDYEKIVSTYFTFMFEEMLEGKTISLPIGQFYMKKIRGMFNMRRTIDRGNIETKFRNVETDGYALLPKCKLSRFVKFSYCFNDKLNIGKALRKKITNMIKEDPSCIYKFSNK